MKIAMQFIALIAMAFIACIAAAAVAGYALLKAGWLP